MITYSVNFLTIKFSGTLVPHPPYLAHPDNNNRKAAVNAEEAQRLKAVSSFQSPLRVCSVLPVALRLLLSGWAR